MEGICLYQMTWGSTHYPYTVRSRHSLSLIVLAGVSIQEMPSQAQTKATTTNVITNRPAPKYGPHSSSCAVGDFSFVLVRIGLDPESLDGRAPLMGHGGAPPSRPCSGYMYSANHVIGLNNITGLPYTHVTHPQPPESRPLRCPSLGCTTINDFGQFLQTITRFVCFPGQQIDECDGNRMFNSADAHCPPPAPRAFICFFVPGTQVKGDTHDYRPWYPPGVNTPFQTAMNFL